MGGSVGCSGTPRVQGGLLCDNTPIVLPTSLAPLPIGYGLVREAPARQRGRLCAGVTWRATDWINLFTMHAYFLARKVGGRKIDPELRVEPFSRTSQAFVRNETCCSVSLTLGNAAMFRRQANSMANPGNHRSSEPVKVSYT